MEPGSEVGIDNLYTSVDLLHMCEKGTTFLIAVPGQPTVEWTIRGVHIVGTLRGNRGSEKQYQWKDKLSKREEDALRGKPLVPDRVKARVTADAAQVMTVAIFDRKGFQLASTVHNEVKAETKPRRVFNPATNRPSVEEVAITNVQNTYNNIMGYVDWDDLISWYYGVHSLRESKYWVPVYLWVVKKRADQAYQLYMMKVNEKLRELHAVIRNAVDVQHCAEREADLRKFKRTIKTHFNFTESICSYHIVKGYNSEQPPARTLQFTDWRAALSAGRRTNTKSNQANRKRPRADSSGTGRRRAAMYDADTSGWPPSRLSGRHRLKRPRQRTPTPPLVRGRRRSSATSTPSPVSFIEVENVEKARRSRTTLFCQDCMDASNVRCMNFHPDCWNVWHGLSQPCDADGGEEHDAEVADILDSPDP